MHVITYPCNNLVAGLIIPVSPLWHMICFISQVIVVISKQILWLYYCQLLVDTCDLFTCTLQGCSIGTGTIHYNDVIMSAMASQITSLTSVYRTVFSGADQRKHQSSASLAFVRGIHRWPVNSPHKWPVTRKMVPFDDVIMRMIACRE